jgi:F-type H+-transporting ATPase subunit epsilon
MALTIEIITPEGIAFRGEADSVVLPTEQGEIGILPGHIPLVSKTAAGDVVLAQGATKQALAVDKGFVEVRANAISILTEAAINVVDIDIEAVEAAQKKAEADLHEARGKSAVDPDLIERLEGSIRFAITQKLSAGRRHF